MSCLKCGVIVVEFPRRAIGARAEVLGCQPTSSRVLCSACYSHAGHLLESGKPCGICGRLSRDLIDFVNVDANIRALHGCPTCYQPVSDAVRMATAPLRERIGDFVRSHDAQRAMIRRRDIAMIAANDALLAARARASPPRAFLVRSCVSSVEMLIAPFRFPCSSASDVVCNLTDVATRPPSARLNPGSALETVTAAAVERLRAVASLLVTFCHAPQRRVPTIIMLVLLAIGSRAGPFVMSASTVQRDVARMTNAVLAQKQTEVRDSLAACRAHGHGLYVSVLFDGSMRRGANFEGIVFSWFDSTGDQIVRRVALGRVPRPNALSIARYLDREMRKYGLAAEDTFLVIGCDHAVTNLGSKGGVIKHLQGKRFRWKIKSSAGCDAHAVNLILNWFVKVCSCFCVCLKPAPAFLPSGCSEIIRPARREASR